MKKLIYFIIAVMFLSAMPEITFAQSNDPFEQQTLKARDNTTKKEKKINRKKNAETEAKEAPAPKMEPSKKPEPAKNNEMTISNPCDEWLDVELVSLIGSKASQTIKLTIKFTNHDVNKHLYVGGNFLAYDCDGNEHSRSWTSGDYNALTDIPIKTTIEIPGKINPANTKVMPVMSFNLGDCRIEMRNVPINWK